SRRRAQFHSARLVIAQRGTERESSGCRLWSLSDVPFCSQRWARSFSLGFRRLIIPASGAVQPELPALDVFAEFRQSAAGFCPFTQGGSFHDRNMGLPRETSRLCCA